MNKRLSFVLGSLLTVIVAISGVGVIYTTASISQNTVLYFEPDTLTVQLGQSFNMSVCIGNVQDLTGWVLSLSWNASVIELNPSSSSAVTEGSFLKAQASTSFQVPQYNVGTGRLSSISCASWLNSVSGNGTLLIICFKAVGFGETSIMIGNVTLSNKSPWTGISYDPPKTGSVTVGSIVHDVAVSIECPLSIFVKDSVLVNATVVNLGSVDESSVNLSILANNTVMTRQTVLLRLGSPFNLSYLWTPSLEGTYVVAARADPVVNETRLDDNYRSVSVVVAPKIHDIAILPLCIGQISVSQITLLNVTVVNLGAFDEKNIELGIIINGPDGPINDTWTLPLLSEGTYNVTVWPWAHSHSGTYNITVYASPLPAEINVANNIQTVITKIANGKHADILIMSEDRGRYSSYGTSLEEIETALNAAGVEYDVWIESTNGTMTNETVLQGYKLVILTCGDYAESVIDIREEQPLLDYFNGGGNVIFEGEKVVSNLVARGRPALPQRMLQVDLTQFQVATTGIEPVSSDPVTQNLTAASWVRTPTWGPDGVKTFGKAFAVMRYINSSFSALTLVDGSETGTGSVAYFSFSLSCLSQYYVTLLIWNCINWFNRCGISTVTGQIILSPRDSVRFIYNNMDGSNESASYAAAGGMLYSICENEQIQGFAGTLDLARVQEKYVCLFENPSSKEVKYLSDSGSLPVTLWQNSSTSLFENTGGGTICSFENSALGNRSMFVVQMVSRGNTSFLVVYGLDWKGTWAAGEYLSRVICCNLRDFCGTYYIFEWEGGNGDSVPQISEISLIASG